MSLLIKLAILLVMFLQFILEDTQKSINKVSGNLVDVRAKIKTDTLISNTSMDSCKFKENVSSLRGKTTVLSSQNLFEVMN